MYNFAFFFRSAAAFSAVLILAAGFVRWYVGVLTDSSRPPPTNEPRDLNLELSRLGSAPLLVDCSGVTSTSEGAVSKVSAPVPVQATGLALRDIGSFPESEGLSQVRLGRGRFEAFVLGLFCAPPYSSRTVRSKWGAIPTPVAGSGLLSLFALYVASVFMFGPLEDDTAICDEDRVPLCPETFDESPRGKDDGELYAESDFRMLPIPSRPFNKSNGLAPKFSGRDEVGRFDEELANCGLSFC